MTLAELTTPFQRRRIIEYGAHGNKVVRHWHDVQHVCGPLYKGVESKDDSDITVFNLYILYEGVSDGIHYSNYVRYPERYTPEECLENITSCGYATLDDFISGLDTRAATGAFIGGVFIEFVRQFDTAKADYYAQCRLDYYAKRENEEKQKRLKVQAEEDAIKAKEREEKATERAKLKGWADNMTDLRFGRVMATLDSLIRVDGKVIHKYEFVQWAVENSWLPHKEEGVISYYGSKWDVKESKPRTEYWLQKESAHYKVSKTEYDFAEYLVSKLA